MAVFGVFWFVLLSTGPFVTQAAHVVASQTPTESSNQTKCVSVRSAAGQSLLSDQHVPYTTRFADGYCREILGNNMVHGNSYQMYRNELKLRRYQVALSFIMAGGLEGILPSNVKLAETSRTCLKLLDEIYCHWYFPQHRISSVHQSVCKEECERLYFHVCKKELDLAKEFIIQEANAPWDIIDCADLPWRNASRMGKVEPDCYYHDDVRDQVDKLIDQDCYYGLGKGYNGNISITRSGYVCQSWSSQCPHQHRLHEFYPELANEFNFCRNPGGLGTEGPWCFTTNPNVTWDYCAVAKCPKRGPNLPPPRVKARSINSTSIQVTWDQLPFQDHRGVLQEYHVECVKHNSSEWLGDKVRVKTSKMQSFTFIELEKNTNYSCRVRAVNNFGNGTWGALVNVSTEEDVPSAPPQGVKAWNTSSTSIHFTWKPVAQPYRHGRIVGYIVYWRSEDGKEQTRKMLDPPLSLVGLEKFTRYSMDVSAVTRVGAGPASVSVTVQTDEDVPSSPPQSIKGWKASSTSLQVAWEPVPQPYRGGRIVGYIVRWRRSDGGREETQKTPDLSLSIAGLRKFTEYSVDVSAVTRMGAGPASVPVTAWTDEDVPSQSVENVQVIRKDPHSITITWEKVAPGHENGNIRGYKILLINLGNNKREITSVNSTNQQNIDIGGLDPNMDYSIRVLPYTAKGDGPASEPLFVRTGTMPPSGNSKENQETKTGSGRNRYSTETYKVIVLTVGIAAVAILVVVTVLVFCRQREHPNREIARIEEILGFPLYEEINENGAMYRNLNMDGNLNLPPHQQHVFIDFEQLYENLRYKRLEGIKPRRRSISGAIDEHGRPIYDTLTSLVVTDLVQMARQPVNNHSNQGKGGEMIMRRSQSVDLGQVQTVVMVMREFDSNCRKETL